MARKCILILLDGLGDRSYEDLNHQTPLQASKTPALDELCKQGANGLYHAASLGQALPSENAHFSMFGYDLSQFPGRGALEALGAGIDLEKKDVAVLSHFVCLEETNEGLILKKGKPEASRQEIEILIDTIKEYHINDIHIQFNPVGGIRGIITLKGNVSQFITDSDPFIDGRLMISTVPWESHSQEDATISTANALTKYLIWSYEQLKEHPVNRTRKKKKQPPLNGLVTQRSGQLKTVQPFFDRHGLRGLSLSSGMIYWGLCTYIGMDHMKVIDTGNPGKDIADRIHLAYKELENYDFVHVHTKTPDEAAHTKNPLSKKQVIESLDQGIGQAIKLIMNDPDVLIIVTSDHSTPSSGPLIHSGESVPLTIFGQGVRRDFVHRFDEISVASGALGTVRGKELMYLILNHLDLSKLMGIMDTPTDQPFWPGHYEPFRI